MTNSRSALISAPVALTIAGSDNSAGAGAQADLKTFSALAVYGLTAITCVVAEVPGRVSADDITVYKSVGNGTQDAALAALLLGREPNR